MIPYPIRRLIRQLDRLSRRGDDLSLWRWCFAQTFGMEEVLAHCVDDIHLTPAHHALRTLREIITDPKPPKGFLAPYLFVLRFRRTWKEWYETVRHYELTEEEEKSDNRSILGINALEYRLINPLPSVPAALQDCLPDAEPGIKDNLYLHDETTVQEADLPHSVKQALAVDLLSNWRTLFYRDEDQHNPESLRNQNFSPFQPYPDHPHNATPFSWLMWVLWDCSGLHVSPSGLSMFPFAEFEVTHELSQVIKLPSEPISEEQQGQASDALLRATVRHAVSEFLESLNEFETQAQELEVASRYVLTSPHSAPYLTPQWLDHINAIGQLARNHLRRVVRLRKQVEVWKKTWAELLLPTDEMPFADESLATRAETMRARINEIGDQWRRAIDIARNLAPQASRPPSVKVLLNLQPPSALEYLAEIDLYEFDWNGEGALADQIILADLPFLKTIHLILKSKQPAERIVWQELPLVRLPAESLLK